MGDKFFAVQTFLLGEVVKETSGKHRYIISEWTQHIFMPWNPFVLLCSNYKTECFHQAQSVSWHRSLVRQRKICATLCKMKHLNVVAVVSPVLPFLISMHNTKSHSLCFTDLIIQPDEITVQIICYYHRGLQSFSTFFFTFRKHQNPTPAAHQAAYLYKLKHHDS